MPLNPVPNYPGALDSLPDPTTATYEDDDGFEIDLLLQKQNAIAEALEVKVGTGASVPTTAGHVLTVTGAGATAYQAPVTSNTLKNNLGADVNLNNVANFFDGPSVSLTAGTWEIWGSVTVTDTAGIAIIAAKLWDGTNVESEGEFTVPGASYKGVIPVRGIVTVASTTTWKISVRDFSATTGKILATTSAAAGNKASGLVAVRIA